MSAEKTAMSGFFASRYGEPSGLRDASHGTSLSRIRNIINAERRDKRSSTHRAHFPLCDDRHDHWSGCDIADHHALCKSGFRQVKFRYAARLL
jgi:hypothetical protein